MRNASGFTLIELVVVISILGILAAFAIPRFVSLETEARVATTQSLAGSVRSAAALSHGLWLAQGSPATVDMEGATITMVNGYPNAATIDDTLADYSGYSYDPATGVWTKDGATTPANCSVTYTPPAAPGDAPAVLPDVSDC
jgi:MSHA pilin protein MshA